MDKEKIQSFSSFIINEVKPRLKIGGVVPDSELLAILFEAKYTKYLNSMQYRAVLDGLMKINK